MTRSILLLGAILGVATSSAWGQKPAANKNLLADAKLLSAVKQWEAEDVPAVVEGKKTKANLTIQFMFDSGKSDGQITIVAGGPALSIPFELTEQKGKRFLKVSGSVFLKIPGFMLEYTIDGEKLTLKQGKAAWDKAEIDFGKGVTLKAMK